MRKPPPNVVRPVSAIIRRPRRRSRLLVLAAIGLLGLVVTVVTTTSDRRVVASDKARGISLFDDATVPKLLRDPDDKAVELGVRVRFADTGAVTAVRFYKGPANTGRHVGHVWSVDGQLLAEAEFRDVTREGWQTARLAKPVGVRAGTEYVVSYHAPNGAYSADAGYFARPLSKSSLTAPAGRNGVYHYGNTGFPTRTWRSANYYVDLVFDAEANTPPPVVRPTEPARPTPTASPTPTPIPTAGPVIPAKPTPTSVPSPTATAPASPGGFPGPGNTGVRTGALTEVRGDYTANQAGSVVKDLKIYGSLFVNADNVTVQNVEVICSRSWWIIRDKGRGTTIQDSTLTVDRSNPSNYCQYGISGSDGVKILRNEISFTPNGMVFDGDTADVRGNWVHDQIAYSGKADHVDAAQLNGGGSGPFFFVGNHFSVPERQTGCLALFADFGVIRNVTVQGNLFDGAGYSVYGGTDSATNVRITDNFFGTTYFPKGGYYGPVAHFNSRGAGNVWSNNRWLTTGAMVGS